MPEPFYFRGVRWRVAFCTKCKTFPRKAKRTLSFLCDRCKTLWCDHLLNCASHRKKCPK